MSPLGLRRRGEGPPQRGSRRGLAPDVFVLPGVRPGIKIDSWKTWDRGVVPTFALEVVSQDYLKDYRDAPSSYDEMGLRELIIFDPEYASDPTERLRWQVYRRLARRGFVRVETSNGDRVRSRELGCWLQAVGANLDTLRIRIATGPHGETLFPTEAEELAAERAAHERESAAHEQETQALRAEIERLAREALTTV